MSKSKPLTEVAIRNAKPGINPRSMAATRLNEPGWNADAIERQLAHAESNKVREAYTHAAQYLEERRAMMQAWADYLGAARAGANVVPIRKASASW